MAKGLVPKFVWIDIPLVKGVGIFSWPQNSPADFYWLFPRHLNLWGNKIHNPDLLWHWDCLPSWKCFCLDQSLECSSRSERKCLDLLTKSRHLWRTSHPQWFDNWWPLKSDFLTYYFLKESREVFLFSQQQRPSPSIICHFWQKMRRRFSHGMMQKLISNLHKKIALCNVSLAAKMRILQIG